MTQYDFGTHYIETHWERYWVWAQKKEGVHSPSKDFSFPTISWNLSWCWLRQEEGDSFVVWTIGETTFGAHAVGSPVLLPKNWCFV